MSRYWLAGIVVLSVVVIGAAFVQMSVSAGRGGETMPLYSNRRFDPYGTAALYRVMERRVDTVLTLERPRFDKDHRGVLLQVLAINDEPWFDELGDEVDNPYILPNSMLLDWIAEGNTLIQMTRRKTAVMEALGIEFAEASWADIYDQDAWAADIQNQQLKGVAPDELDIWDVLTSWRTADEETGPGNRKVVLNASQTFTIEGPEGWRPRLWNGGEAHGGEIPYGKGRVIFVGSPSPALNHYLGDQENLIWLTELLGDDVVIFDEWAHGIGHGGTILETVKHFGMLPFLLQIPVWLLFYRWSAAGRSYATEGGTVRLRLNRQQVNTLGRLFDQAWDPAEKRRRVYDEVLIRLGTACRCDAGAVESRLQARGDALANRGLQLIKKARALATASRPRCNSCDYELTGTRLDHCPECGHLIPVRVRRLLKRDEFADVTKPAKASSRWSEATLARILNDSNELAQELKRV